VAKVKIVKERRHSQRLASKIKFDSKTIDKLQKNIDDQRSESEAQVKAADEKIRNLKRVHNSTIDGIKIKYHAALRKQQLVHVQIVERKKEHLKKIGRDVNGMREMFSELLDEVSESKQAVRTASASADKAAVSAQKAMMRSSLLYNKLKVSTGTINALKDEINDEMNKVEELRSKVDEYKGIIDNMEKEYELQCNESCTKISSLEAYYKEVIAANSPRYVMKKWVKNKTRGKSMLSFDLLTLYRIITHYSSTQHRWAM
jgi:chromosome segregation ATPase